MKLREDIIFYKYNENAFHMYDKRNNKHFNIGLEQKKWLELFDGNKTLTEIRSIIPEQYVEQFLEYVNKYNLLDDAVFATSTKFNLFKIKIKLADINSLLDKKHKQCVVYANILNGSSLLILLCNLFLLYKNANNLLQHVNEILHGSLIVIAMLISYILLIITGLFHEISHAFVAKANDIAIPEIGIMLFYFNPAFYVDLSGIRILSDKLKRIEVLSAGIKMNNLMLLICLVTFNYYENYLIKGVLAIYIFVDLIMILINIIPFVEFDGYYILSEMLGTTDLKLTATIQLKFLLEGKFNKVQIHYVLYFIYSILYSSAFIVLGLTTIIRVINTIIVIPNFISITLLLFVIVINFRYQIKKRQ